MNPLKSRHLKNLYESLIVIGCPQEDCRDLLVEMNILELIQHISHNCTKVEVKCPTCLLTVQDRDKHHVDCTKLESKCVFCC